MLPLNRSQDPVGRRFAGKNAKILSPYAPRDRGTHVAALIKRHNTMGYTPMNSSPSRLKALMGVSKIGSRISERSTASGAPEAAIRPSFMA